MPTLDDARTSFADAVTSGGITCLPYPPDAPSPPLAFVDSVDIDFAAGGFGAGGWFCLPGSATATIVMIAQRNDRPGSTEYLEGLIAPVLESLESLPGVRVANVSSGQSSVGGQDLPSIVFTTQFAT